MNNQDKNNREMQLLGHRVKIEWKSIGLNKQIFPEILVFLNESNDLIEHELIDKMLDYLGKEGFLNESTGKHRMFPSCAYCVVSNSGKRLGSKGIKSPF
jgi:hypothetical protein